MLRAEVQLAWKTQAGHRHQVEGLENEDAVYVTHDHPLFDALLMVADGMGGHPRPREASETAVRAAREFLSDPTSLNRAGDIAQALAAAVGRAHAGVQGLQGGGARRPPGTTLSIAAVAGGMLYVCHVGDGSVFLMRDGQVRSLAGGEDRRAGNRPSQFLGQPDPPQPEEQRCSLAAGDRILLCTDGLTRYFGEAGLEALERVVGRRGVEIGAVASQLTAHSRPDEYDDDTTVALAEVTSLAPATRSAVPAIGDAPVDVTPGIIPDKGVPNRARPPSVGGLVAAAVAGAALLAAGFAAGRLAAVPAKTPAGPIATEREPAGPEDLRRLPAGNVVLLDPLGRRVWTLSTRSGPVGSGPVALQAFRVGENGRFTPVAGSFRLDPSRAELTTPDGRTYPVDADYTSGALRILRGGTLVINTHPPAARIFIDEGPADPSPVTVVLTPGKHQVRAEGRSWTREASVEVVPGATVTLNMGPQ